MKAHTPIAIATFASEMTNFVLLLSVPLLLIDLPEWCYMVMLAVWGVCGVASIVVWWHARRRNGGGR